MLKTKYKVGLALLATAASALSGCGSKKNDGGAVEFWSCFGTTYSSVLDHVVAGVQTASGVEIDHKPQGSYDQIYDNMVAVTKDTDYPNLAIGYPDHFASYLGSGILEPLNDYFTEEELSDYYDFYLKENKFYDNGGKNAQEKIFGIPFNKSTELMGYNGVFVDYCASIPGNEDLAQVPATWSQWASKGPRYNVVFKSLFGKGLYGRQNVFGTASDFEVRSPEGGKLPGSKDEDGDISLPDGKKLLLDMSKVSAEKAILFGWDATDNAFITLVRQWGAEYTKVDPIENTKIAKKRIGSVMFNSSTNKPKVANMLKFFRELHAQGIFGTPQTPLNADYCSNGYELCQVMFMICSSGGLSYNTADWHHRFRVAPVPYNDETGIKAVISQGANITMTATGNYENAAKVIKAFTTGKWQTEWCLQTGYYPCSKSATNSAEYQAFVHEGEKKSGNTWVPLTEAEAEESGAYTSAVRVAYREGSKLNDEHYMNTAEGWDKFVDPAFEGSSRLRKVVDNVFDSVLSIPEANMGDIDRYYSILSSLEQDQRIKGQSTIQFIH